MAMSCLSPSICQANAENFFQEYYDTSSEVITNLKKCSSISDQFSKETTNCYINSSLYIQNKTKALYQKNKTFFETRLKESGEENLSINSTQKLNTIKQACVQSYPEPLRSHFKNQILECQAQVDLQRYFFFYTYMLNS